MKFSFLIPISSLLIALQGWAATAEPVGINPPANPWAEESNLLWVEAEALLWQAFEDNLQYVMTAEGSGLPSTERNLITPHSHWYWGYRVGVGYQMPHDGWDGKLLYTHITNYAKGESSNRGQTLFQYWGEEENALAGTITHAKGSWRSNLDQFDLNLGREYFVGKHMTLRPNGGLRTTWLFQKYDIHYTNSADVEQKAHMTNRFWGFGLVGGVDTDWRFVGGFSLYGSADYALLLGFFDLDQKGYQDGSSIWDTEKSFRSGTSIIDMELGIKWSRLVSNDQLGFIFKAGYEYHLYFDQNQFVTPIGSHFRSNGGNLAYQGVVLSGQINF
jgi:hypothetical protein